MNSNTAALKARLAALSSRHSNLKGVPDGLNVNQSQTPAITQEQVTNELPTIGSITMNSLDLLGYINDYRESEGKKQQSHSNFMKKVRDELEEDALTFKGFYTGKDNAKAACYHLPKDECMRMALRESKFVRKNMVKKLNELLQAYNDQFQQPQTQKPIAPALPDFSNPVEAARAWADEVELKQLAHKALELAAPKVEYCDKVLSSEGGLRTTEIATQLGMSAIALNKILHGHSVQRRIGTRWVLTVAFSGKGYDLEKTFIDDSGTSRHSLVWTEKGRNMIHEIVKS